MHLRAICAIVIASFGPAVAADPPLMKLFTR
jgi:hypothetical protein